MSRGRLGSLVVLFAVSGCEEDSVDSPPVQITEVVPTNTTAGGGVLDYQGESADWFELYNPSSEAVGLGGLHVTTDPRNPPRGGFERTAVIPPGGFLLVFADRDRSIEDEIHAPLDLDLEGTLRLMLASGEELQRVDWPAMVADQSWALQSDGTWEAVDSPTPLAPND